MGAGSVALRYGYGYTDAANLLDHWFDGSGTPYQIDPKKMMDDIGGFKAKVDKAVAEGFHPAMGTSIMDGRRPASRIMSGNTATRGPRSRIGGTR
jgi:hypothetical protein